VGPFPDSLGRSRYVVFFRDSCTKYTEGYPIHTKDGVTNAFRDFVATAETEGISIKELYSDKGGEYVAEELTLFCQEKRIKMTNIATESPQSNGSMESYNGVIQTAMRCNLSLASKVGKKNMGARLWAESIRHAIMSRN
jgi:transposase InsO family protein